MLPVESGHVPLPGPVTRRAAGTGRRTFIRLAIIVLEELSWDVLSDFHKLYRTNEFCAQLATIDGQTHVCSLLQFVPSVKGHALRTQFLLASHTNYDNPQQGVRTISQMEIIAVAGGGVIELDNGRLPSSAGCIGGVKGAGYILSSDETDRLTCLKHLLYVMNQEFRDSLLAAPQRSLQD